MEKEPLVSIIIPIYQTAPLLIRCFDSIEKQTYRNIEVWMIDDGSTDKSNEVCALYCKEDARFHYHYQENGGVSSARNTGMQLISGEYVCFVDSDDWVEPGYIEAFVRNIGESDMVIEGRYWHMQNATYNRKFPFDTPKRVSGDELEPTFYWLEGRNQLGYLWSMMLRCDIIEKNKLRFIKGMACQEDLEFVLRYCCFAKSICMVPESYYHYYFLCVEKGYVYSYTLKGVCHLLTHYNSLMNKKHAWNMKKQLVDVATACYLQELSFNYDESYRSVLHTLYWGFLGKVIWFAPSLKIRIMGFLELIPLKLRDKILILYLKRTRPLA